MPRVYLVPLEAHFYRNDLTLIHQTVDTARDGGRHDRFAHIEIVGEIEQRVGNPGRCLLTRVLQACVC